MATRWQHRPGTVVRMAFTGILRALPFVGVTGTCLVTGLVAGNLLTGPVRDGDRGPDFRVDAASVSGEAARDLAEIVLIGRCMQKAGFDYPVGQADADAVVAAADAAADPVRERWPDDDEERARSQGLRAAAPEQGMPELRAYIAGLGDRNVTFTNRLQGTPGRSALQVRLPSGDVLEQSSVGCSADAQRRL